MRTIAPGLALALALLVPVATGANAEIHLEWADGVWNVESRATGVNGTLARIWVPSEARLHEVLADDARASWRAASASALEIDATNASVVVARFDLPARAFSVARIVAPQDYDRLAVSILPEPGTIAASPDVEFAPRGLGAVAVKAPAPEGTTIALRAVDEGRFGELPILLSVLAIALVAFVAGVAWHRMRPPLEGREPAGFLDHLTELQGRLLPPAVLFVLLNLFYFVAGLRVLELGPFALVAPTFGVEGSLATRSFEAFAERLTPPGVELVVLRPIDAVLAQVEMTLFLAFVTVLPLLLYEIAAFIGPALTARERRLAGRVTPLVAGLFVIGALVGYLVMTPLMIATLYSYAPGLGAASLLVVGDLVSFALLVMIAMGLAFELPVVMYVLSRLGVVRAATFRKYFRHAIVAIFLAAGILTPDPSVVSQAIVAVPVTLLYALGLLASSLGEGRRARSIDAAPA